jgi:hypothetical protein
MMHCHWLRNRLLLCNPNSIKIATMDGYQHELELSDDPYDTKRLNTENIPSVLTLMKVCRLKH